MPLIRYHTGDLAALLASKLYSGNLPGFSWRLKVDERAKTWGLEKRELLDLRWSA